MLQSPRLADATRDQVERVLGIGDIAAAAELAEAALAQGMVDAMLLNLAAWRREEAGDYPAAHALLTRALTLAPNDSAIITAIGTVWRKQGQLDAALGHFDQAIELDPTYAVPWLERGYALDAGGALDAAGISFRRAALLDPGCAPAVGSAASVAARLGQAQARALAERALALDPGEPAAITALIAIDLEAGEFAAAVARARTLTARNDLAPADHIAAQTLLGDALDRIGDAQAAFAAYSVAQGAAAHHARAFAAPADGITHRRFVEAMGAAIDRVAPTLARLKAPGPVDGEAAGHVFLLGYPRSGTTLTENILASSPHVAALEERPTLAAADAAFFRSAEGIDRLAGLGESGATQLRRAYWAKVADCGAVARRKVFVDMDPLKGIKLPAIARLFPSAHIVVMRRDPRDVVLSCFRRNFRLTAATYEFTSLEGTARHYVATMALLERSLEVLPLRATEVRYDALVGDFDATASALCRRIGVPWSPDFRRFDRTAVNRGVATASVTQVRRGLYDGSGAWRRYARELEPVLPILAPWVERLGFAP